MGNTSAGRQRGEGEGGGKVRLGKRKKPNWS